MAAGGRIVKEQNKSGDSFRGVLVGVKHTRGVDSLNSLKEVEAAVSRDPLAKTSLMAVRRELRKLPRGSLVILESPHVTVWLGQKKHGLFTLVAKEAKKMGLKVVSMRPGWPFQRRASAYNAGLISKHMLQERLRGSSLSFYRKALGWEKERERPEEKAFGIGTRHLSKGQLEMQMELLHQIATDFLIQRVARLKPRLVIAGLGHIQAALPWIRGYENRTPQSVREEWGEPKYAEYRLPDEMMQRIAEHRDRIIKREEEKERRNSGLL